MNYTFRGRLRFSHLAFPAGLLIGYFIALFDKYHQFQFISSLVASSSMLQLFAVVVIVIAARWILEDFKEHFQKFFSVYSLKLDSIKELGEKRMNEIASSKQNIEASLQKLEKIPVQQNVQDIHEKLDQLINVLNRSSSRPKNEAKPWNHKSQKQSRPAQLPQPKWEKAKQPKQSERSLETLKPQTPAQLQPSTGTESMSPAQPDPENWASQVI